MEKEFPIIGPAVRLTYKCYGVHTLGVALSLQHHAQLVDLGLLQLG